MTERYVNVSLHVPAGHQRSSAGWTRRAPGVVFAVVELFGFVLWLVLGGFGWFFLDDWDFLAGRTAGDLGDLFRPHNDHWTTVPILAYRLLYWAFGLSFVPYRIVLLVLHLIAAALLVLVMRRAGVRPWIATAAGSSFVLFAAGWENIISPIEIAFTGALVFGLAQLLLSDHDGRLDRRDWLGLVAGLLGLMTSGVAVTMVTVVGLAVLLRRGWRVAIFHTAPLAACYMTWLVVVGYRPYQGQPRPSVRGVVPFVATGVAAAFRAIGQVEVIGIAIAVVLVVGGVLAWSQRRRSEALSHLAAPVALLGGPVVFLSITATGRLLLGADAARASRYLYLVVAMMLPGLAIAADAMTTRWRWFFPIAIAMFMVGIPGGFRTFDNARHFWKAPADTTRREMLSLPQVPLAQHVPRSLRPDPSTAFPVTVGWLLDGVAQHRIPVPSHISPDDITSDRFRLSFYQQQTPSPATQCHIVRQPLVMRLKESDVIGLYDGRVLLNPAQSQQFIGQPLVFDPARGTAIVVLHAAGPVRLAAASSYSPPRICTGPA